MRQYLKTNVGILSVYIEGDGLPMILWPSVFMDHTIWEKQISALAMQYKVIAIDPPGHGKSASIEKSINVDNCSNTVVEIMDALDLAKAAIVGVSWGGMVAISFASRFPDRCLGIAILNSSARNATLMDKLTNMPLVVLLKLFGFIKFLQNSAVNQLLGEACRKERPEVVSYIKGQLALLLPSDAAIVARDIFIGRQDQRNRLASIKCPTLIIGGEEDVSFPPYHSQELHNQVPGSTLILLEKVGHLAPLEASEVINDLLISFLDRLTCSEY